MKLIIYTDGASRGNPGHASYGFTISGEKGKLLYQEGKYIGIATNNVAEYMAVLEALKYVKKNLNRESLQIELFADSRLVVEQLSGRFKVKSPHLKPLIGQIQILKMQLGGAIYNHVPREKNSAADRLANLALDSHI
ncbi:MAG: ribonuclease HI family protein [Candidatus Daviesbacteria bacterium]|nr:ribonuclease HI family protein [Candidatus Daviesbacteria bacterium]